MDSTDEKKSFDTQPKYCQNCGTENMGIKYRKIDGKILCIRCRNLFSLIPYKVMIAEYGLNINDNNSDIGIDTRKLKHLIHHGKIRQFNFLNDEGNDEHTRFFYRYELDRYFKKM